MSSTRPQPAADAQRDEDLACRALDDVGELIAAVEARDGIHEDQLVGAVLVVEAREALRLAEHAQPLEVDALDEVRALDVEARNDADGHRSSYQAVQPPSTTTF